MGKIKAILKDLALHLNIWVKEPVYKPEVIPIKKWRKLKDTVTKKDKDGFTIVDGVRIEDTELRYYNHNYKRGTTSTYPSYSTTIMNTSGVYMGSAINMTGLCYPNYFKDYLNETSSDSK